MGQMNFTFHFAWVWVLRDGPHLGRILAAMYIKTQEEAHSGCPGVCALQAEHLDCDHGPSAAALVMRVGRDRCMAVIVHEDEAQLGIHHHYPHKNHISVTYRL